MIREQEQLQGEQSADKKAGERERSRTNRT